MASLKGEELEKGIADMRTEVSTDKEVSLIEKRDMVAKLENFNDVAKSAGKADKKKSEKEAKDAGEKLAEEAAKAKGDTFVGVVKASGDDAKALSAAADVLTKKCTDKAVFLLSNAGGKLAILAIVPKALQGKISAKAWTDKVLDAIGGKGGGKDDRAQGQVTDPKLLAKAWTDKVLDAIGGKGGGK